MVSIGSFINALVANLFSRDNKIHGNKTKLVHNDTTSVIEIYDALGKLVISKTLNHNQTTISTTELMSGMYTYSIKNSAGVINRGKLIKE